MAAMTLPLQNAREMISHEHSQEFTQQRSDVAEDTVGVMLRT